MKSKAFPIISVIVLLILNGLILQKELLLSSGRSIFLRLAPRDPRSMMQGDYMALNYQVARDVQATQKIGGIPQSGILVVQTNALGIATYSRLYDEGPLKPDEVLLKFRYPGAVKIGAESFFFQEGHASRYEKAVYGELKVDGNGNAILVSLCDQDLKKLGMD